MNKTETRVELLFAVEASAGLTQDEKEMILQRLSSRIQDDGLLVLVSQKSRSQLANKEHATARLHALLQQALIPKAKRIRTKPSAQSVEDRLKEKKLIAEKKAARRPPEAN